MNHKEKENIKKVFPLGWQQETPFMWLVQDSWVDPSCDEKRTILDWVVLWLVFDKEFILGSHLIQPLAVAAHSIILDSLGIRREMIGLG